MGKLGVLAIGLVVGGVLFFVVSMRSSRSPIEREFAASGSLLQGEGDRSRRSAADLGEDADRSDLRSSSRPADRTENLGTLGGQGRRTGSARIAGGRAPEESVEVARSSERRLSHSANREISGRRATADREISGRRATAERGGGSNGARRGELVDFLSRQQRDDPAGRSGALDAEIDPDVEPEEDEDGVLLSVPLVSGVDAEGYTQPMAEENLGFDEDGEGVEFPEDAVLAFPDGGNIRGEAGSFQLEIEPNWSGNDPGDNSFVQVRSFDMWQGRVSLYRNGEYLRFVWFDDAGIESGVGVSIRDWVAGERHAVTATWGEALQSLYIDGQLVGQNTYSGNLSIPPGTPLFLGSNPRHHVPGANAKLSSFKVYGRALPQEEVSGP